VSTFAIAAPRAWTRLPTDPGCHLDVTSLVIIEDKKPQPERDQTDASLRTERRNSDQAIAERLAETEEDADDLLERARHAADAVLSEARKRADRQTDPGPPSPHTSDRIAKERAIEDDAVRDERATADDVLRRQRAEQARVLATLLPLERDQTDRYLLTERARSDDAIASRDDFLGIVSHDLRNLLSGIVLSANLLTKPAADEAARLRTLAGMDRIQRYAARMNRLIGDLIDVVSIDAGKLSVRAEPADATALLTEAVDAFTPAALQKQIALVSETRERPLMAHFDHGRLLQVLANLITNALKFTPPGGRIAVRGERSRGELRVSVSDTGCGMSGDMLEPVFERFWQIGKNDRRGVGLGLYIARCIVEAHGGRIWAESTPGKGSDFHLTIPIASTREEIAGT
jgi:signal transduction histidine kinase